MKNKKNLWIAAGILIVIALCGLSVYLSGGMMEMIKAHMGG
jgi:hypothetical protein